MVTMLYIVLFADNPERAEVRQRLMPDHLDFLTQHASAIRAAGPLCDPVTREGTGGLWLVEADTPDSVKALYEGDPLWPSGLRKSVRVLEWRQVFVEGRCTV
jgi:uncharacterized protein YciI